ncbi:MAG: YidH family protein, partial [Solirubrobacterales bacterium]
ACIFAGMAGLPPEPETLRLHQANERTMLAWMRTGIALMAFGFAIARFGVFLRQVVAAGTASMHGPRRLDSAWLGAALVAAGMITSLSGTMRYRQVRQSIERGSVGAPSAAAVYLVGTAITLIGLAMSVLLAKTLGE